MTEKAITTIVEETGLEGNKAAGLVEKFTGFVQSAKELEAEAREIVVTDSSEVDKMKHARELRLQISKIRINAEKQRKTMKEQSLREGRAIDGVANIVKALTVPAEEHLKQQEKFVEMQRELELDKIEHERVAALSEYIEDVSVYNLRDMTQEGFDALLNTTKSAREAEIKAEQEAENARLEKERAEREEAERLRVENEKLKKEADERAARDKAEAEKREAFERELRASEEAERLAAEQEAEKKRQQELAPDKEKLLLYASSLNHVEVPKGLSDEAYVIISRAQEKLLVVSQEIKKDAEAL